MEELVILYYRNFFILGGQESRSTELAALTK